MDLASLTKPQLTDKAAELGIDVKSAWNKGKIIAAIEAKIPAADIAPTNDENAPAPAPADPGNQLGDVAPTDNTGPAEPDPAPSADQPAAKLNAREYDPTATYVVTAPFKATVAGSYLRFEPGQTLKPSVARTLLAGGVADIEPRHEPDES